MIRPAANRATLVQRLMLHSALLYWMLLLPGVTLVAAEPPRPECIAPAKPGGGFDLTCRLAQTGLGMVLENPVQVTFMPRGVGAVAFAQFNTTRTDDQNAIVAFSTGSLLNIVTGKFGQWTEKDVRIVATIGTDFGAIVVRGDSHYQSLDALMDMLTDAPASIVIGAGGSVGSQDWMKAALLLRSIGKNPRDMRYVSFDGGGEAATALLGGHIDVYAGDIGEMKAHIGDNKFRILAILSDRRLAEPFDDIPTASEQGYDVVWRIIRGFYVGRNVPDESYEFWVATFREMFAKPDFAKLQRELGLIPFNHAGANVQQEIVNQVGEMRRLAIEMGLLQ